MVQIPDGVEIPDDLQSAYVAEQKAEDKLAVQRAKSVKLRTDLDSSQAKVRNLAVPFEATRETRRTLEREYGIGEWTDSGIPAQVIEAIPGSAEED